MIAMHGRGGDTILVNGAPNPLARVPNQLVRLRLVNGSNARIYELSFSDGRNFHWIGADGGLLERSVGCCRSKGNLSVAKRNEPKPNCTSGHDCAPLSQGGGASLFVDFAADEVALLAEMVVNRRVDGDKF